VTGRYAIYFTPDDSSELGLFGATVLRRRSAGQSADQLLAEVADFSHKQTPIDLTGLAPVRSCRYDSLAFDQQPEALPQLASECVTRFEQFRAPLTEADVQRRNPDSLTESQRQNMYQYGYPHVLNDFNFHMTLSGHFHQPDRNTSFLRIAEYLFQ